MTLKLFVISLCATLAHAGFLAYDCTHQLANMTRINIIEPSECQIPTEQPTLSQVDVILVQSISDYPVHTYQCKVEVERIIMRCGTFSDSLVAGGFMSYVADTSVDECRTMHLHKTAKLFGHQVIHGLESNSTRSFSSVLAGEISSDGACSGGPFHDNFGSWTKVYVTAQIRITLKDNIQQVNNADQTVRLPSGHHCKISDQHCIDPEDGFTFWSDIIEKKCEQVNFEKLFEGKVNKSVIMMQGVPNILYTSNSDTSFSLMATTHTTVCGHKAIQTEHPKLKIIETNGFKFEFRNVKNVFNLDLFTYMNSKFTYVERHIQGQLNSLHKSLLMNQCRIEKSLLSTQLSIASIAPSEFAYLRMNKPGYTAMLAGEVIYLVKCQAVSVTKVRTDNCFLEFPVSYKNETYYMTPKTRLLQKKGTQIACSDIIPVNYQLDGSWYSFSPNAHSISPPESVMPKSESDWTYVQPANMISSGVYSEQDIENLRKQLMFPLEKGAALNSLASSVSGFNFGQQDFNYENLASESQISSAIDRYFTKATGWIGWVGQSFSFIIGLWFTLKMIKFFFDTTIHGWALYKKYGFDMRMGAMFWDALTTHFLSRQNNASTSYSPQGSPSESEQDLPLVNVKATAPKPSHIRLKLSMYISKNTTKVCVPSKQNFIVMFSGVQLITASTTNIDIPNVDVLSEEPCFCDDEMYMIIPQ